MKNSVTIDGLSVTLSERNIHIQDSYTVRKRSKISSILSDIQDYAHECELDTPMDKRSMKSMVREWVAHNNLHTLGIYRKRTGSVDLDYPQKWYLSVGYFILSIISL